MSNTSNKNLISIVAKQDCVPTIHDFYIGKNSPFENTCVNTFAYAIHFKDNLLNTVEVGKIISQMFGLLKQGNKIQLVCFCKTKHNNNLECHGEVIKLYLLSLLENKIS